MDGWMDMLKDAVKGSKQFGVKWFTDCSPLGFRSRVCC